ncbi:uncharacterized protein CPUR_07643 [Claviceps purpurea 20.1]|uniref:Uncharacterized protein n=1 Tax=Claviceps purpurea (strain 20.1) TaxID=1111077 RepID=M1VY38_CLAP2|nr:hypothetical protein E4U50_000160 [Claviceps purpurea]CCE33717.1 uncharacterized protein CPUR_07643 [Claviceps purpurea 20.1]
MARTGMRISKYAAPPAQSTNNSGKPANLKHTAAAASLHQSQAVIPSAGRCRGQGTGASAACLCGAGKRQTASQAKLRRALRPSSSLASPVPGQHETPDSPSNRGPWRTGQWARARRRLFSSTEYASLATTPRSPTRALGLPACCTGIAIAIAIASVVFPIQVGVATPTALAASRAASPTAR